MKPQTQALLIGGGTLAAAKLYFKLDWKPALIASGAVLVAFLILTDFGTPTNTTT